MAFANRFRHLAAHEEEDETMATATGTMTMVVVTCDCHGDDYCDGDGDCGGYVGSESMDSGV